MNGDESFFEVLFFFPFVEEFWAYTEDIQDIYVLFTNNKIFIALYFKQYKFIWDLEFLPTLKVHLSN